MRRYIEDAIAGGVSIDDMVYVFKLFNERNGWNLDPNLFSQTYAEYYSEPHKEISRLKQHVATLDQRILTLEQVNNYYQKSIPLRNVQRTLISYGSFILIEYTSVANSTSSTD